MRRALIALTLASVLITGEAHRAPTVTAPRSSAFTIGILRRDGIIVPFATFDGKGWGSSWPVPRLDPEVPISLSNVSSHWWGPAGPLSEWQIWPMVPPGADRKPSTVHVVQPDWIPAHCLRQIALRTDYRSTSPVPPATVQPYPKDALAVAPPQEVEPIEILDALQSTAVLPEPDLLRRFNQEERRASLDFDHPIRTRTRETIQPKVEALYGLETTSDDDKTWRIFYVEAERAYTAYEHCLSAFGTGWFIRESARTHWLQMSVDLLSCSLYGASYMLPLGALRLNGKTFWLAQFSGWDQERYVVIQVRHNTVEAVVNASGGGC